LGKSEAGARSRYRERRPDDSPADFQLPRIRRTRRCRFTSPRIAVIAIGLRTTDGGSRGHGGWFLAIPMGHSESIPVAAGRSEVDGWQRDTFLGPTTTMTGGHRGSRLSAMKTTTTGGVGRRAWRLGTAIRKGHSEAARRGRR